MAKNNYSINCYIKSVDRLKNFSIFYRTGFFLLLLLVSFNHVKAQSPDIITKDIKFESEGVSLAGTVYTPQYSHAAVVLVHGSGQESRMRDFALLLAKNGISVFTYDKRGVGESDGVYAGPEVGTNNVDSFNLNLLAKDASAAINILHQQNKNIPIGLIGFSQAGWIIPIATNINPLVDFMVIFCGSVVPTLEQLRFQFFTDGNPNFWDNHTEAEVREHILNATDRYQFENTDPYDTLSKLSVPGIWLLGGKDIQIPVGLSIERLNTLKTQSKPYEYCFFPSLGHNVAFSDSTQPIDIAIHWIKERKHCMRSK